MNNFFETIYAQHSRFPIDFHTNYEKEGWDKVALQYKSWLNRNQLGTSSDKCIPKIIHQIWIGSRLPDKYKEWADTWQKYHPDYKYYLWTEKNIRFKSKCLENAYANTPNVGAQSDIARYAILQEQGGIYCDTDLECIRNIDALIENTSFMACSLFSSSPHLGNGFIASVPSHHIINSIVESIKAPIKTRDVLEIIDQIGPGLLTKKCLNAINQAEDSSIVLLPSNYCYCWPNYLRTDNDNPSKYLTSISFSIHYWEMSWTKSSYLIKAIGKIKNKVRKLGHLLLNWWSE